MAKENLFDDISLEDARERLQEVSEYMDKVIDKRIGWRRACGIDDLSKDRGWNIAHDVLEIVHSFRAKPGKVRVEDWATAIQEVSRRCFPIMEEAARSAADSAAALARETTLSMEQAASVLAKNMQTTKDSAEVVHVHIHGDVYDLDDFKRQISEALNEHVKAVNKGIERAFEKRRWHG